MTVKQETATEKRRKAASEAREACAKFLRGEISREAFDRAIVRFVATKAAPDP